MKKNFILTLCVFACTLFTVNAQKVNFPTNDGSVCFTNESNSKYSKAELFESAVSWAVSTFASKDAVISQDLEKGEVLTNGTIKTKSSYNPFAGWFNEYATFVVKFNVSDNHIKYNLYKIKITETYSGYGSSSNTYNLDDRYASFVKAYEDIERVNNDPNISKKDRKTVIKEANDIIEENEDSFIELKKSLQDVINMMEKELFR